MVKLTLSIMAVALTAGAVAQQTCNSTSQCGSAAPCCSSFGYCSTAYCFSGCQPYASFKPTSCHPAPICQDKTIDLSDVSRIAQNSSQYHGNWTKFDMLLEGGQYIVDPVSDSLILTLTDPSVNSSISPQGTKLSTTNYIRYGTVEVVAKTSSQKGVVSAFILMSDTFDEVDFEFTGASESDVLTNYFRLGAVPSSGPGKDGNTTDSQQDLSQDFHTYTLKWSADKLEWFFDNNLIRTVQNADTSDGLPSTPVRVQVSIWPGGGAGSPAGTRDWAGGAIDFSDSSYTASDYFFNAVKTITIKCEDPDQNNSHQSYIYGAKELDKPTFALSNTTAIMSSAMTAAHGGAVGLLSAIAIFLI